MQANYGPISTGFTVFSDFPGFQDSTFYQFGSSYVWPGTKTNVVLGGHAVMCYGYDDDMLNGQTSTSTGVLFCKNSWGTWWGDGGYFKIAYGADGIMSGYGDSYGFVINPVARTSTATKTATQTQTSTSKTQTQTQTSTTRTATATPTTSSRTPTATATRTQTQTVVPFINEPGATTEPVPEPTMTTDAPALEPTTTVVPAPEPTTEAPAPEPTTTAEPVTTVEPTTTVQPVTTSQTSTQTKSRTATRTRTSTASRSATATRTRTTTTAAPMFGQACQEEKLDIGCRSGTYINVTTTFWGRNVTGSRFSSQSTCYNGKYPYVNYMAARCGRPVAVLNECRGWERCVVERVSDANLGNSGCQTWVWKMLTVSYTCLPASEFGGNVRRETNKLGTRRQ